MALKQALLNLFFPQKCPLCGALLDKGTLGLCPACAGAEFWFSGAQALFPGKQYARCACAGAYTGKLRDSVLRFKFSDHPEYAKTFGPILAQTIRTYLPGTYDCISWMPVSRETLQKRGYDQAQLLAQEAAKTLGRQAVPLLVKMKSNVPQSSLRERRQRLENVAGVYSVPHPKRVAGQRVLLIDDILTTGATLGEGARVLREAGAFQVVAATLCRTQAKGQESA